MKVCFEEVKGAGVKLLTGSTERALGSERLPVNVISTPVFFLFIFLKQNMSEWRQSPHCFHGFASLLDIIALD